MTGYLIRKMSRKDEDNCTSEEKNIKQFLYIKIDQEGDYRPGSITIHLHGHTSEKR
jgi:hypothetical protein